MVHFECHVLCHRGWAECGRGERSSRCNFEKASLHFCRAKKILNKRSTEKKQTELADVQNKKVDAEKIARAQRMNEYRQEAENFLNKKKEAKFKV